MESNLATAARELQELQQWEMEQKAAARPCTTHRRFPPSCLGLLRGIEGNLRCVDCDATNPQWATVSFGALLCITCSGNHRQLGVQVSIVRSISMDSWSHSEILSMLEGGNKQLNDFFQRHDLPPNHCTEYNDNDNDSYTSTYGTLLTPVKGTRNRYKTNAAQFYSNNLALHAMRIQGMGLYNGRDGFRKDKRNTSRKGKKRRNGNGNGNGRGAGNSLGTCAVECGLAGGEGSETNNTVGSHYR